MTLLEVQLKGVVEKIRTMMGASEDVGAGEIGTSVTEWMEQVRM